MTAVQPGQGAPPELGGAAYPEPDDWDTGEPEPLALDSATADPADAGDPAACSHPASARRLAEVEGGYVQVCSACGEEVPEAQAQAIVAKDRPGTTDPTQREGDERSVGGLRHITWDPANPASSRPYTPEEVELELVDTLDRIERGAGWLTTVEEKRSAAKLRYELDFARARFTSTRKTVGEREDDALLQCRDLYEEWQLLEMQTRTGKEGLHNLRSKANVLQSVLSSTREAMRGGGGGQWGTA